MGDTLRDPLAPVRPDPDEDRYTVLEAELAELRKLLPPAPKSGQGDEDSAPVGTVVVIGLLAGIVIGASVMVVARPSGVFTSGARDATIATAPVRSVAPLAPVGLPTASVNPAPPVNANPSVPVGLPTAPPPATVGTPSLPATRPVTTATVSATSQARPDPLNPSSIY